MGVDDVVLQGIYRLHRVIAHTHGEVGGIQVDRDAGGTQGIQEGFQDDRLLGPGLHGEVRLQGIGVGRELPAGLLHDLVCVRGVVVRHPADVGRYHVGAEFQRQIQNALASFHVDLVQLRIGESLAEVAAEGGDHEPQIVKLCEEGLFLICGQILLAEIIVSGVDLHAFSADGSRLFQRCETLHAEAFGDDADFERIHNRYLRLSIVWMIPLYTRLSEKASGA